MAYYGKDPSSLLSCCFMSTEATYGLIKATYGLLGIGQSSLLSCCFTSTVATYGLLGKGPKLTIFVWKM